MLLEDKNASCLFQKAFYAKYELLIATHLRTTGVGAAVVSEWIGGMVWPALGDKLGGGRNILPMSLYAFKFIMSGICALLLPIETLGRELEDNDNSDFRITFFYMLIPDYV